MAQKLFVLGALVCVVTGALVLFVLSDTNPDPAPPEPQPSIAPSPTVSSVVPEISAFVEKARGLKFKNEVEITELSQPEFEDFKKSRADPGQVARLDVIMTILGLLPPEGDLATVAAAVDPRTAAFYDPVDEGLLVTGELTPHLRKSLVRELTRALDDQHFGIDREFAGTDAEAAFEALAEGSAIRVERLYVESLSEVEQSQIADPDQQGTETAAPPAAEQLLSFPQTFGAAFVEALLKEGPDRLDRAFTSPPLSTEQVLDPARFLSGDAPQAVKPPHTEGPALDEGDFGPLALRLLLESKLDAPVAAEAAAGWDGDRYVTWRAPDGRTCIRVAFAADSPQDSRQLEHALAAWVDHVTDREVDSAGKLLKACERRS